MAKSGNWFAFRNCALWMLGRQSGTIWFNFLICSCLEYLSTWTLEHWIFVLALCHIKLHPYWKHLFLFFLHGFLSPSFPFSWHFASSFEDASHPIFISQFGIINSFLNFIMLVLLNALLFYTPHCLSDVVFLCPLKTCLDDFHLLFLGLLDSIECNAHEFIFLY